MKTRLLYCDTVSHRVRERYSQLHYIAATAGKKRNYFQSVFNTGIAYSNVGYKSLVTRSVEYRGDTSHCFIPSASTTISMSLSPRPDRLTTIICSLPTNEAAILAAWDIAWAGSRAGRMPSVRHRS